MAIKNGTANGETINGSSSADEIYGLGGNDALYGNDGDDYLDGGTGTDTLSGGKGNDKLVYDSADFIGAGLAYNGGTGTDTLIIKNVTEVDFTKLSDSARLSLEIIDMEGGGPTALSFKVADVRAVASESNSLASPPLVVNGDKDDKLFIEGFHKTGTAVQNGHTYTIYSSGAISGSPTVWADVDIQVNPPQAKNDTGTAVEAGGKNNGTAGSDATGNVLTNDVDLDGDVLSVSDVRVGPEAGPAGADGDVGVALKGAYGSLTLGADGKYTYAVDNDNADVQKLNVGKTLQDTFTYTVTDGLYTDTAELVITVQGANDNPVAKNDNNKGDPVVEAGSLAGDPTATGNVLSNDTDVDDTVLKVTAINGTKGDVGKSIVGTYGSVVIAADGKYTYTLDNADPDTQKLKSGEVVTEEFKYTVSDPAGASDVGKLTISITGADDPPVAVKDSWFASTDADFQAPDAWFVGNDTDIDSTSLSVVAPLTPSGSVDGAVDQAGSVQVSTAGANGFGGIDYTVSDGELLAFGHVDVAVVTTDGNGNFIDLSAQSYQFSWFDLKGGGDVFVGGTGADTVRGGSGADFIFSNDGDDNIDGQGDNDSLDGGKGNDTIAGGDGQDGIAGGDGDDTIDAGASAVGLFDFIRGDAGNDKINVSAGDHYLIYVSGGEAANGTDAITGFDADKSDGHFDFIDLDGLFDGLGYPAAERSFQDGFLIVDKGSGNYELRIDISADVATGETDANQYTYLLATFTGVTGTLDQSFITVGS